MEFQPNTVEHIPLDLITADPNQPRKDFDVPSLQSLATDITRRGVQQPITIRPRDDMPGNFYVVYGERRLRASRLAKQETVPALLYNGDDSPLERLLDQVKENHLRQDLNPIEWADFFYVLHKTHKQTYKQIEATLKENGITNMGRAYISNIVRLKELPEWAAELIRSGNITAAHGKHILPATVSDTVINALEKKFQSADYSPTTREVVRDIYYLFEQHHTALTGWKTDFDYKFTCVKTGCQKMRKVTVTDGVEQTFCLDGKCWSQNDADHRAAQTALQRENGEDTTNEAAVTPEVNEHGQVDIANQPSLFDEKKDMSAAQFCQTDCERCPHHLGVFDSEEVAPSEEGSLVEMCCFNKSCFNKKQAAAHADLILAQQYLRNICTNKTLQHSTLGVNLIFWSSANRPDGIERDNHEHENIVLNNHFFGFNPQDLRTNLLNLNLHGLQDFLSANSIEKTLETPLISTIINHMANHQLATLCKHLNVTIDSYRIDTNYLAAHTQEEVRALLGEPERTEGIADLDAYALTMASAIKVPNGIRWAWKHITDKEGKTNA